jgi:hypothetical protein
MIRRGSWRRRSRSRAPLLRWFTICRILRSEDFAEPPICNVPECFKFTRVNQVSKSLIELFIANDALFSFAFVPDANVQHGDFQLPMTGLR